MNAIENWFYVKIDKIKPFKNIFVHIISVQHIEFVHNNENSQYKIRANDDLFLFIFMRKTLNNYLRL